MDNISAEEAQVSVSNCFWLESTKIVFGGLQRPSESDPANKQLGQKTPCQQEEPLSRTTPSPPMGRRRRRRRRGGDTSELKCRYSSRKSVCFHTQLSTRFIWLAGVCVHSFCIFIYKCTTRFNNAMGRIDK